MTTSQPAGFTFHEIQDDRDPILLPWLDLYETAFPAFERFPVSIILSSLQKKGRGEPELMHCIAGLSGERLVSMACYHQLEENAVSFLTYLAVDPGLRGSGVGSLTYQHVIERSQRFARMMMFDVEQVELAADEADRQMRARRIDFYRRLGARMLCGVDYVFHDNPNYPPLPLYLMIHPLVSLPAEEAYERALRSLKPGCLKAIGPLEFA